ncbi:hypothetical protein [Fodinicola feengrottensis]|uniref:hypothetical protein n=1 Tax=Fodinicola feengrottensis TaxID=435914 RepID=UPI0013D45439|nr:hypothetical protein [Fodinicola feengrottensis]
MPAAHRPGGRRARGGSRQWWSPAALVAVLAAGLLAIGPWTPLATIGLGGGRAYAAAGSHVGVIVDFSGQGGYPQPSVSCADWSSGITPVGVLMAKFDPTGKNSDRVGLDANRNVCKINTIPADGCTPNASGYWVFAYSKTGNGAWASSGQSQSSPVDNGAVVGWKYVAGPPPSTPPAAAPLPGVAPDINKTCPVATASPTPPRATRPPRDRPRRPLRRPTANSNTNTAPGTGSYPSYPPTTYGPGSTTSGLPTQPAVPGAGDGGIGSTGGFGDQGAQTPGVNPKPAAATFDTRGWTRWGLILVAAGMALVMVTGGLFTSNLILSRRASAKKGRHRVSTRRLAV